jgi:hypothetical protein
MCPTDPLEILIYQHVEFRISNPALHVRHSRGTQLDSNLFVTSQAT